MRRVSIGGSDPAKTISLAQALLGVSEIAATVAGHVDGTRTNIPPGPVGQTIPPARIAPGTSDPGVGGVQLSTKGRWPPPNSVSASPRSRRCREDHRVVDGSALMLQPEPQRPVAEGGQRAPARPGDRVVLGPGSSSRPRLGIPGDMAVVGAGELDMQTRPADEGADGIQWREGVFVTSPHHWLDRRRAGSANHRRSRLASPTTLAGG